MATWYKAYDRISLDKSEIVAMGKNRSSGKMVVGAVGMTGEFFKSVRVKKKKKRVPFRV